MCPVCGEDWVNPARIAGTENRFWLCSKCDSVWLSDGWIGLDTSEYLEDYMRSHGYEPTYGNIERLDESPRDDDP